MSDTVEMISVPRIHLGAETQARAELDTLLIDEYAAAMKCGAEFPPIVAFVEGAGKDKCYWIGDGHHRSHAAHAAGLATIAAIVRPGTKRDAILYAVGANANHGARRTNADKRRAVKVLLSDQEWRSKTNVWIAEQCRCAESFVRKVRGEEAAESANSHNATLPEVRECRDGTSYTMPTTPPQHEPTNTDRQYDAMKSTPAKVTTRRTITATEKVDTATGEIVDEANEPAHEPVDEEGDKLREDGESAVALSASVARCYEERKAAKFWLPEDAEWAAGMKAAHDKLAARFAALER